VGDKDLFCLVWRWGIPISSQLRDGKFCLVGIGMGNGFSSFAPSGLHLLFDFTLREYDPPMDL
jgi:hypothetical protein